MIASSEEKRIYDELVKAVAAYRATVQEVVALAKAGKNEEVQQIRRTTWVKAADQVRELAGNSSCCQGCLRAGCTLGACLDESCQDCAL